MIRELLNNSTHLQMVDLPQATTVELPLPLLEASLNIEDSYFGLCVQPGSQSQKRHPDGRYGHRIDEIRRKQPNSLAGHPTPQDRFLIAVEVAPLFKLNVKTVDALIAEGQLPATDSGVGKRTSLLICLPMAVPVCGRRGCRMRKRR